MPTILDSEIKYLPGVGPQREKVLRDELGIHSFNDLLLYFPYKYIDRSKIYRIREVTTEMPYIQIKGHIMGFAIRMGIPEMFTLWQDDKSHRAILHRNQSLARHPKLGPRYRYAHIPRDIP